ncbi:MAG: hypothetical protein Q7S28_03755, partial [bacterium]|nr:hypothetical protein [bacterium]
NANLMLVALKDPATPSFSSPDEELNEMLGHLWKGTVTNDVPLLTDDYVPVEYYFKNTCAQEKDNALNTLSSF